MGGSKKHLFAAIVLSLMVLVLVPIWFMLGAVGGAAHIHGGMRMGAEAFREKIQAQQDAFGLPDGSVKFPPDSQIFILAQQFSFAPKVIRLEQGAHYHFAFFSPNVLHGASLQFGVGSFNTVILPNRVAMMSFTATGSKEIRLLCNEYCGLGHHLMQAQIIVEEALPVSPFPPKR